MKKLLLAILALTWCSLSFADISEGVKSWLKEQGAYVKPDYRLVPVIIEDLQKADIVEFDYNGENTYGIVFAAPKPESDNVAVDVGGITEGVTAIIPVAKTEIKGAVRLEKGSSTFLGPIHPHHFAFGMPTHPYSSGGFPHRRNA